MKYAIFIEPKFDFFESISMWKKVVGEEHSSAPYLTHPPHATLIFTHLKDVDKASDLLRSSCAKISPLTIKSKERLAFYDDPLAGGGHTLAYRLENSAELFDLQKSCAEVLEPVIDHGHDVLPEALAHPMFQESFSRFSFPFVGSHWIPHMTVASIPTERDAPMMEEFLSICMTLINEVETVSLWAVDGDIHQKIEIFPLGKKS
jgi:2'-5' RNA ligase